MIRRVVISALGMKRVSVLILSMVLGTFVTIAATPASAYASDGFLGGLQDLVGAREVDSVEDYELEYIDGYNPQLRLDPPDPGTNTLTDIDEDATTVDYVNNTLDSFNKVRWWNDNPNNSVSLVRSITLFMQYATGTSAWVLITTAAGLVFMWWGLRKCIQMVMSGFRKGSMNV